MIERGSDKHGPHLDEQMKHESEAAMKGRQSAHAEEFRQTEPFPDETDDLETRAAMDRSLGPEGVAEEEAAKGESDEPGAAGEREPDIE